MLLQAMALQMELSEETFLALITLVRLHAVVGVFVILECCPCGKTLAACQTLEALLFVVNNSYMFVSCRLQRKFL